jgi:S1-C subfamily serine protease
VFAGTAARAAGLVPGDVIVAAGGQRVTSPDALQAALGQHHPGDRVGITWVDQSGARHTAVVTLKNGPAG